MDHATLGLRVARARTEADVSQGKLGEMVGLDRSAISRAEKGERKLTMAEMVAIAEALGRPLGFFVNDPVPAVVNRRAFGGNDGADLGYAAPVSSSNVSVHTV